MAGWLNGAMAADRVDPLLSYARRVGNDVKVVLVVEREAPVDPGAVLRLRDGETVDVPVTLRPAGADRDRVEAVLPGDRVGEGTWRMKLVAPGGGERRNLQTRVLIRSGMPVALLPGRPPATRLEEPEPRS